MMLVWAFILIGAPLCILAVALFNQEKDDE